MTGDAIPIRLPCGHDATRIVTDNIPDGAFCQTCHKFYHANKGLSLSRTGVVENFGNPGTNFSGDEFVDLFIHSAKREAEWLKKRRGAETTPSPSI